MAKVGFDEDSAGVTAISKEVLRENVEETIEEYIESTIEQTEAALDKVMNEKISAIHEYSGEVLSEIKKNHEEVLFLYDMLSDKEKAVKNTVKDVEAVKKSIKTISKPPKENQEEVTKAPIPKTPAIKAENVNELTNNNEKILDLYKKGVSNMQIAKELGLGIGEVRLVIDLFNNRQ